MPNKRGMVTGNGRMIECDLPDCEAYLTVPIALVPQPEPNKHRWAEGEGWTWDDTGNRDWCPRLHLEMPAR